MCHRVFSVIINPSRNHRCLGRLYVLIAVTVLLNFIIYQYIYRDVLRSPGAFWKSIGDQPSEKENLSYCDFFNVKSEQNISCGNPFNSTWIPYLERLNLSRKQIGMMTDDDDHRILMKEPVFVTAFSDNHFSTALDSVINSFRQLTNMTFFVYDLGLNKKNLGKLRNLSYISVRHFNFSAYPSHVQNLFQFRWKPLVIAELLQEYESVLYADAHIRWHKDMNLSALLDKARCLVGQNCSFYNHLALSASSHNIHTHTDKKIYNYIPMDMKAASSTRMIQAGVQLVYYTKDVRLHIWKWFVLCALEEDCMAPNGTTPKCPPRANVTGQCHRQDQSILGILLANRNRYMINRFLVQWAYAYRGNKLIIIKS